MTVASFTRRQFANAVSVTDSIPAGMSDSATSFEAADGSTFPDGSTGHFIVTVDQGASTEERILCSTRSGNTFNVDTRGYNGYAPQNHGTNATLLHTTDQQDFDEANNTAHQTLGQIAGTGDLLIGGGANTLSRLARGTAASFLQVVGTTVAWTGFGSGRSQAVGSSNADGTDTTPARSDHTHAGTISFNSRQGAVTPGNADYLAVASGLTGAVAATRFVGATASGAPVTGTFAVGDFVIDQTGLIWVCTVAGTSGTWAQVGLTGNIAGRAYTTASTTVNNNNLTEIGSMTSQFLKGGMTVASNRLVLPVAGIYRCSVTLGSMNLTGNATMSATVGVYLWVNGVVARQVRFGITANYPAMGVSELLNLNASDEVSLAVTHNAGATAFADPANGLTQTSTICAELVSQ